MTMRIRRHFATLTYGPHMPKRTVRLRLTLLYGGVFVLSGAALVAISYVLINNRFHNFKTTTGGPLEPSSPGGPVVSAPHAVADSIRAQQNSDLHQFLLQSLIALAVMAVVSVLLGWLLAGRALHPIRTMTARTRRISERNLHERLALAGPDDELKHLGDTIDGLLVRLEAAFDSQRTFVANASHELRTPLMLEQTMLQVALADPHLTLDTLRATCQDVLAAGKEQERLIKALLTLARSQRGLDQRQPIDLADMTNQELNLRLPAITAQNLRTNVVVNPAAVAGDEQLIRVLLSNLIENAIRHNHPGGTIDIEVNAYQARSTLTISNTGRQVAAEETERLLQPFQRLNSDRSSSHHGLGLGLSIVAAIAAAHAANLAVSPRAGGGLSVTVAFPSQQPLDHPALPGIAEGKQLPPPKAPRLGSTQASVRTRLQKGSPVGDPGHRDADFGSQ
jgi:signal transduction histidine kinase